MSDEKSNPDLFSLIERANQLPNAVRTEMRKVYMDKLNGQFKGVKWRSLSPDSQTIRVNEIKLRCVHLRKGLGEAYPDSEYISLLLKQPVIRLNYYRQLTKQTK